MITRFSEVVLVRRNGKMRTLTYKTERPLTDDLLYSICSKLGIEAPEWNKLSRQFEFTDSDSAMAPDYLIFYDRQGFRLEGFEEE